MKIAVFKEMEPGEKRVAVTPDVVKKMVKLGFSVIVQTDAGNSADFSDEQYKEAGAEIESSVNALYDKADIIVRVQPPDKSEIKKMKADSVLIGFLEPYRNPETVKFLAEKAITSFSMETIPRISRAQSMDALSSQASAAGYKAVLIAAEALKRFFPMLTTAAGTVAPARVFIIGAGVAGLQAIATAKRLGAVVEGFDIRPAAKGEVESLGARFVQVELDQTATAGGYAREISDDEKKHEHDVIRQHVASADVVITTAQVPGKKAPMLVTKDMVAEMKPGSIIVDLAGQQGGNCELTEYGKQIVFNGVTIIGPENLPAQMAFHASQMYARNIFSLITHLVKDNALALDFNDQITSESCLTHQGKILNARV